MANDYYWCPVCADMLDSGDPLSFCECGAKWEVRWSEPDDDGIWAPYVLGRYDSKEEAEALVERLTPEDEPPTHLSVVSVHPTGIVVPGPMPKWDLWREMDGTVHATQAVPWAHSQSWGPHGAQLFAPSRQAAIDEWTAMFQSDWEREKQWQ